MWVLLGALLLLAPRHTLAERAKAVVVLDPPWDQVLEKDSVKLTCQGPGDSAQWWHNGRALTQQTASLTLTDIRVQDSGEYSCQTGLSAPSDPQSLQVHVGWLLLQALRWTVRVGDPIRLRCHSWQNKPVSKVIYFRNGIGLRYFHQNAELHIPAAELAHNGTYFCRGLIGGRNNESSHPVRLLVQDPSPSISSPSFPSPSFPSPSSPWHQIVRSLAVGLLLALNTGLFLSVWCDLRRLQGARRRERVSWSRDLQDK